MDLERENGIYIVSAIFRGCIYTPPLSGDVLDPPPGAWTDLKFPSLTALTPCLYQPLVSVPSLSKYISLTPPPPPLLHPRVVSLAYGMGKISKLRGEGGCTHTNSEDKSTGKRRDNRRTVSRILKYNTSMYIRSRKIVPVSNGNN